MERILPLFMAVRRAEIARRKTNPQREMSSQAALEHEPVTSAEIRRRNKEFEKKNESPTQKNQAARTRLDDEQLRQAGDKEPTGAQAGNAQHGTGGGRITVNGGKSLLKRLSSWWRRLKKYERQNSREGRTCCAKRTRSKNKQRAENVAQETRRR
jgi:hypothetical protein